MRNEPDFKYVAKHGVRKDGGKWFLIKKTGFKDEDQFKSFAKYALQWGYEIPDLEDEYKDVYLFGEPRGGHFAPILQCPECSYALNITQIVADHDYQHLNALRVHDFVNKLYPKH